jgi:hypothetical protein
MSKRPIVSKATIMSSNEQPGISPLEIANDFEHIAHPGGGLGPTKAPTIEEKYHAEREQARLRHWKGSDYAAGLVEPTWSDELENYRRGGGCCCCRPSVDMGQMFRDELDPGCGCIYLSAVVCTRLGAGRIGNMAVLKERYVMVEVDDDVDEAEEEGGGRVRADGFVEDDEEGGSSSSSSSLHRRDGTSNSSIPGRNEAPSTRTKRLVRKREIQLVLGPFWPMLLFITYPLIFGVSALTLHSGIPGKPWFVQAGWAILTLLLIRSLFNTGFRDPGILKRHASPPPEQDDADGGNNHTRRRIGFRWGNDVGPWRWTDQAQSYRPRDAQYCTDCKVVIEEFDHT